MQAPRAADIDLPETAAGGPGPRSVRVAGAGLLRMALWPLDVLRRFDAPELARCALETPALPGELDRRHAAELSRQRDLLCAETTTAAFARALALANPVVAQRWRRAGGRAPSARSRDVRLEATVFRFLCRAGGRPTPQGAWAGVADVTDITDVAGSDDTGEPANGDDSARLAITPAPPVWRVSPSLVPFVALARVLGATPEFLAGGAFELESTLHRRGGGWVVFSGDRWRPLPRHRIVDELVDWFAAAAGSSSGRPLRLGRFVDAVAADDAARRGVWQALDALRTVGVLRPAVRPSVTAGSALDSLALMGSALPPDWERRWQACVNELAERCAALAANLDRLDGDGVDEAVAGAAKVVAALWDDLGLAETPPGPPLQVDAIAPVDARWSAGLRRHIAAALDELIELFAADGTAERYRRLAVAPLREESALDLLWRLTSPVGPAEEAVAAGGPPHTAATRAGIVAAHFGVTEDLSDVEGRWWVAVGSAGGRLPPPSAWLRGPWSAAAGTVPACGAHLVAWDGERVRLQWGRPQPGLFSARHQGLDAGGRALAELAAAGPLPGGGGWVELAGRDVANPDAALRPAAAPVLDLADRRMVERLRVRFDAGVPVVDAGSGAAAVLHNSAVAVGRHDPLTNLVERVACGHGWELLSFGFPLLERELAGEGALPAVVTAGGALISARRAVLAADWVAGALAAPAPERYASWVRALAERGFGDLVEVRAGLDRTVTALPMPARSPLAVEVLFAGLGGVARPLLVEDLDDADTVPGPDGAAHRAELTVTWWRA